MAEEYGRILGGLSVLIGLIFLIQWIFVAIPGGTMFDTTNFNGLWSLLLGLFFLGSGAQEFM